MPRAFPQYTLQCPMHSLSARSFLEIAEAVLHKGAALRFQASGSSMHPLVRNGDVVTVTRLPPGRRYRPGDIVLFRSNGSRGPVIHRILRTGNRRSVCAGDNACQLDQPVKTSAILGRVTRVERRGRSVRFGLGPERSLIRLLVRARLFRPLARGVSGLYRLVFPKTAVPLRDAPRSTEKATSFVKRP